MTRARALGWRPSAGSPFTVATPPPVVKYASSDRVTHDKYGLGRVVAVEEAVVVVDFGACTVRIPLPYGKLSKL